MSAVVTGIGVVAPNGLGLEQYWAATLQRRSAIRRITRFDPGQYPSGLAGEVTGFDVAGLVPGRLVPQTDRMTQFAIAAAGWAVADADLDASAELPETAMGVITASSSGGFDFGQRELQNLWSKGPDHVSAYMSFAWFYAVNSGQLSIRHGMRGPTGVFVTEQAGGIDAIAHARRRIRAGTRLVLTGGMESSLCPYGYAAQIAGGRLSEHSEPERAYLPFAPGANGHVPGEGGAILTIEPEQEARQRGARIYGEIAGYGASFDARDRSNLVRAIRTALDDAGMSEKDIGVVFADAAGLPELDAVEARALAELFGPRGVPVTAPKTMTGRLYAGAAPLDVVAALMTLRDKMIPPTAHVRETVPGYQIDLVTERPRPLREPAALVVARGRGGFNSAMVVR